MKRKVVALLMPALMGTLCLSGCGNGNSDTGSAATESSAAEATGSEEAENADQKAADEVAALIDAIYVQERTDETDQQCADATAAWDALSD